MSESETATANEEAELLERLIDRFDRSLARLARTRDFAKSTTRSPVLDASRRMMGFDGGVAALSERVAQMEESGLFTGTDWDQPDTLQPLLAANTLRLADPPTVALEALSEIRLLAVAEGRYFHRAISAEQAHHFLAQAIALNLELLFGTGGEAGRVRDGELGTALRNLYTHIVERIGYSDIFDKVVDEILRLLAQRPIQVEHIKAMVTQIAVAMVGGEVEQARTSLGADRLISALYGPSTATREDPGVEVYAGRLAAMDQNALSQEAGALARAMHDTGLVSPYHAVLLRHLAERDERLVPQALGLSPTGNDAYLCYTPLIRSLIDEAIYVETAQAIYGLSLMLERGILYMPAIGPGLWRQIALPLCPAAEQALTGAFGSARPARVHLLAAVLSMLGQPLGVGQGNNPTCQSARALSMWAFAAPDYLLQIVAWAARDDEVIISFEGEPLSSKALPSGLGPQLLADVDAVSSVVVPHLDRIYMEMGRRCDGRGEDPHRWINPELHGWWVGRGYAIAVDVASGKLADYESFVRRFYAVYHPYYNGNQPVIHPQPAGIAITDSAARYVGWHAITIYRVGLDPAGEMRVYFYNPNNDSGQDWGDGVVVSTSGHGERYGESSLPVAEFASRVYLFHFDLLERGHPAEVPEAEVARAMAMGRASWAAER